MKSSSIKFILSVAAVVFLFSCGGESHKSDSDLKTMIYMAEAVQKSNELIYNAGNSRLLNIKTELGLSEAIREKPPKITDLSGIIDRMDFIDNSCAKTYTQICEIQARLLKSNGNNSTSSNNNSNSELNLCPINFRELKNPLAEIELKNSNAIQGKLKNLRDELCQAIGTYQSRSQSFVLHKVKEVTFKSEPELSKKRASQLAGQSQQINNDDRQAIGELYIQLTMASKDLSEVNPTTLIGCLALLTNAQNRILAARELALRQWSFKVNFCGSDYNKIQHVIDGPNAIKSGEDIDLSFALMAYDSYTQPEITIENNPNALISYDGEGKAQIKIKQPAIGNIILKGAVSIKNKAGFKKTQNWEKTIEVIQ